MSFDGDPASPAKPDRRRVNLPRRWPGKRPLLDNSRTSFLQILVKYVVRDIVWLGAVGVCALTLGLASVFLYLNPQIPTTETYRHYRFETPLRIFTADGALVAEFGNRLIPIDFHDVPVHFVNALLNTEDKRFYDHAGIDLISLANDVVDLFLSDVRTGASTITMQLAKQVSFGPEQRMIRKLKEMLLAIKIERELTKDEILELYVNIMAFGKQAYGVQAAAHTYYGRPVAELDLAQLAMLAGIIKKPTAGNPINGPEWALDRRNLVLRRMRSQGSIDQAEYEKAVSAPITAAVHQRGIDLPAPYPAEWVRQQLIERYGTDIYTGFVVYTTLDSKRQAAAQRAVRDGVLDYDIRHGYRGPEGQLGLDVLTVGEGGALNGAAIIEALGAYEMSGGRLEPAVVVELEERRVEAMRASGEVVGIDWDGLRWAPYLDADRRGPTPRRAAEIVSRGDVIRVLQDEHGAWRLRQLPEVQAALVALDPRTGAIQALVGGWDFLAKQFNHALQAARQPGSGFKPFVYSAALANGVTPASVFLNAPLVFEDDNLEMAYRPRNDSGEFSGPMRLREALARSINMVSMRVMTGIGAGPVLDHLRNFGFETANLPRDVQLAIGGGTMMFTPLDMARAYAVLANGGFLVEPNIVDRVERLDGSLVFEGDYPLACEPCPRPEEGPVPPSATRAIDEANAFVMDTLLRDVIAHPRGTGRRARELERPDLAGKTGTTDQSTDTWFNGYHPHLAATVWVGFSDHRPTGEGEYGSRTPLTIWMQFMRDALADEPVVERPLPDGVVRVKVNRETGRVARPDDPNALFEYFLADSLPERAPGQDGTETRKRVRPEDIF